jgi:MFS superfamily sulfate permease-like transporter
MIIPQSIGYAALVGVPAQYGLFTALVRQARRCEGKGKVEVGH